MEEDSIYNTHNTIVLFSLLSPCLLNFIRFYGLLQIKGIADKVKGSGTVFFSFSHLSQKNRKQKTLVDIDTQFILVKYSNFFILSFPHSIN